jgi:zinc/manganese transport system permease protein
VFSGFMVNAWLVASVVAVLSGLVGFFVVLRGEAFVAHAVPNGAFAGAAAASLAGTSSLLGLGVFSLLGALGIGRLARGGRRDVATALVLVFMLGLGALFLSLGDQYSGEVESLLFGEVLGISANQVLPTLLLAVVCATMVAILYRPLLLDSIAPELAASHGVPRARLELAFLVLVALATTLTVPVVGALLIFSLMVGAPSAARSFVARPGAATALSVAFALAIVWAAIALSYLSDDPIGFFVGVLSALAYTAGRVWRRARS